MRARRLSPLRRLALGLAALLVALAASAPAVVPGAAAQAAYQPEFDLDVVATRGERGPQLDVYTAIPYQNLRFLARADGFEASYAVTVQVYRTDARGRPAGLAHSRTWERALAVPSYAATQAPDAADRAVQTLAVEPGRYSVQVTVEDGSSRRTFAREAPLVVRSMDGPVAMSDPMLLEHYDADTGRLEPNVGAAIATDQEAFTVFYEIYAEAPARLQVTYVVTEQNRVQERPSFRALLGLAPRQQAEMGTPLALSEMLDVPAGTTPATLRVPTERFSVGDYVLAVRLEAADGTLVAEAEKPFAVRWLGLEGQISDLDAAIAQLRYIAKDREIRAMRNAPTQEEKLRLFREFWARRDPTPGTRRNERMEEYYYRVAYANQRYSRLRDAGWSTDRGEVFIRFGEPDFIEDHPFNYGTQPYQVWFYNRFGRRFIFVDQTGMGDFRLLVPIWDERTRM